MKSQIKRPVTILLAVLFVVSLTAVATSAARPCDGSGPRPLCLPEHHISCVNGMWTCVSDISGYTKPIHHCERHCDSGHRVCVKGKWIHKERPEMKTKLSTMYIGDVQCPWYEVPDCGYNAEPKCYGGNWVCEGAISYETLLGM